MRREEVLPRVEYARLALNGLSKLASRPLYGSALRILTRVHRTWTTQVWSWIQYLYSETVLITDLSAPHRLSSFSTIVDVLSLFSGVNVLRECVIQSPGLCSMLAQLWYLEIKDPDLSPYGISAAARKRLATFPLCKYVLRYTEEPELHWVPDILVACGGTIEEVASTSLAHLRLNLEQPQLDYDRIFDDVQVIGVLADHPPFSNELISQQSIRAVTLALVSITSKPIPAEQYLKDRACGCIFYICLYLKMFMEEGDGITLSIRALEAKLLPALLRCDAWVPTLTVHYEILQEILSKYVLYSSVLRRIVRSMEKIEKLHLENKLLPDGTMKPVWEEFKARVHERLQLSDDVVVSIEPCGNPKVCSMYSFALIITSVASS